MRQNRARGASSGGAVAGRLPYRGGMLTSALGLGVFVGGLAARGGLSFDGSARIAAPGFWPEWLAEGSMRIMANGEFSDPRLLFAGIGFTLLLVGVMQIVNDFIHRDLLD